MARHSQIALGPMGLTAVDPSHPGGSTAVDQDLAILRSCVSDLNYTLDSLESAMGKNRAYIHKVLNGDKPLSHEFQLALPAELRAEYRKRQAEQCGHIVVTPAEGVDAVKQFASGLLGMLAPARKIASGVLVAGVLFGAGRPVAAQSSAAGVIARQVLTDPTTYTPAVANYVFARLDWASSQPLFARGYLEQDPDFTLSGRADAAPVPDGVGRQQILMNALLVLGWSAAANVGARVLERQLRARDPEHARLWCAVSLALRVGVAGVLIDADVLPHVHQWRTNLAMAGGLQ